jgi:predicted nucleotidyltransferase
MTTVVIMPGGFHPFHAGHYALYQSAQRAFPDADVYVAATNDTSARPFPFPVKEKLAKLAGVEAGHFVQVKSPFRAEEITAKFDPARDTLIFVRSEKDSTKPPQPGGVKKDGSPSYLQPLLGAKKLEPFAKHAYMAYLPTVEFGPGMTSATEIRTAWPQLNDKRKTALVMSLYPRTQGNAKLAATVVGLLDAAIGSELDEDITRRGFLKGAGAAAITGLSTPPTAGGQFVPKKDIDATNSRDSWNIKQAAFQKRSAEILEKLISVSGQWKQKIANVKMFTTLGEFQNVGGARVINGQPYVKLETTVLHDAPDSTLAWIIGHELGHHAYAHTKDARENEDDADAFGSWLCQQLGINQASFFKFLYGKKAEFLRNTDPNSIYPHPAERVKQLQKSLGFELSKAPSYIDSLISHLAENQDVAEGKQPGQPVVDAIQKILPIAQEIWFHGSRAIGKHRRNSDTDILVVVPDDLVGDKYLAVVRILQKLSSHFDNYDIQPTKSGTNIHRIAQEEGRLLWSNNQGVAEGAPIVVAQAPIDVRNPKKAPQPYRNQGDIVPDTKPPSTEKRGVKGRPGQRPMPQHNENNDYLDE